MRTFPGLQGTATAVLLQDGFSRREGGRHCRNDVEGARLRSEAACVQTDGRGHALRSLLPSISAFWLLQALFYFRRNRYSVHVWRKFCSIDSIEREFRDLLTELFLTLTVHLEKLNAHVKFHDFPKKKTFRNFSLDHMKHEDTVTRGGTQNSTLRP